MIDPNIKQIHAFADDEKKIKTTCSYCGVGCGIIVGKDEFGDLNLQGDKQNPVNQGKLCSKGRNLHYTVMNTSDRLLYPQMRSSRMAPLKRVSWEKAMSRATSVFRSIIQKHGPDSVAFYVSGQLLSEEYYLVNKLAKGIVGTANIDTNSRLCMSSAVVAYKKALGEDSVPISYDDIELCDCFLIAGANPAWCHPIIFQRIEKRKETHPDTKIIIIDPRRTASCEIADLHLQIKPATDITVLNAIARLLIENNKIDSDFLKNHVNGFEELKKECYKKTINEAAIHCDISEADIRLAAKWIGDAKTFLTLWAMGLNQSVAGVRKNLSLINLNLLTGKIGKPGSGPFSLTGQPNAMGGREVGGLSNMLAAHRDLTNPKHRLQVAEHWDVPVERIPDKPGRAAIDMFNDLHLDKIKAVWIICTNPLVSLPDSNKIQQALNNSRFVIVQDISNRSDTIEYADLVFPAAGWLEKEGTMTNSERRISHLSKLVEPPGEARPDAEIFQDFMISLSESLYNQKVDRMTSEEVFREHAELTKNTNLDISGLNYTRLKNKGSIQWPVPDMQHSGTKRLFTDHKFFTKDGRANLHACDDGVPSEKIDEDFPFVLTTGRIRDQWHTRTRTGKVKRLCSHLNSPYLEMHGDDAKKCNLQNNQLAKITSRRGELKMRTQISNDIRPGLVFANMHWGKLAGDDGARVNNVTNAIVDPDSKEPDFKFSAVHIAPLQKKQEKIVVIGAGAAAYAFADAWKNEHQTDQLDIYGAEKEGWYNRINLPEYIDGSRNWDDICYEDIQDSRIRLISGIKIIQIDRKNHSLTTQLGQTVHWDKLVLATGSKPNVLPDLVSQMDISDVHVLRDRLDALKLKQKAREEVLIIGGGLLGIELADALLKTGKKVHLVHRSSHLMSRQLDSTAAGILSRGLKKKGLRISLNEEVLQIHPAQNAYLAYLGSGLRIRCTDVVFALGTKPRTSLAIESGLNVDYGIEINNKLQTSDPNIYAIGECVEFFKGDHFQTFGTTQAAREMGESLARILAGEPGAIYNPTSESSVLKVENIPVTSFGQIQVQSKLEEVVLVSDVKTGRYQKCIIKNDKLIGCILIGDTARFGEFQELFVEQLELAENRLSLLGSSKTKPSIKGELICSCNRVGSGNILDILQTGESTIQGIGKKTGAGVGCGSCRPSIMRLLKEKENAGSEVA